MRVIHFTCDLSAASGVATFVRKMDSCLRAKGVDSQVVSKVLQLEVGNDKPDLVHIHGLWLGAYHKVASCARKNSIPVVWSTHGMTAPWSMRYKWWKKLPAWLFYQKRDLLGAFAIHCTTDQELEWNRKLGLKNCFIAPLGTDLLVDGQRLETGGQSLDVSGRRLLFVGRIHPVKGLENLIRAWGMAVGRNREADGSRQLVVGGERWRLRVVGPDEGGYLARLKTLVASLELKDRVEFVGSRFGGELQKEYDDCDCLVLPSFTENFGATVVDAMAYGKPVIASTFTPWKEVSDRGCGWWVSNEPGELAKAIVEMIEIGDEKRRAMGQIGQLLVGEKYAWGAVADTMIREYNRIRQDSANSLSAC